MLKYDFFNKLSSVPKAEWEIFEAGGGVRYWLLARIRNITQITKLVPPYFKIQEVIQYHRHNKDESDQQYAARKIKLRKKYTRWLREWEEERESKNI